MMLEVTDQAAAEGFLERAEGVLTNLLEVKVTTTVEQPDQNSQSIVTTIKLLDGDVTTSISEALLANTELRAFHQAQVKESLEVLPRNLEALIRIAKSLLN